MPKWQRLPGVGKELDMIKQNVDIIMKNSKDKNKGKKEWESFSVNEIS